MRTKDFKFPLKMYWLKAPVKTKFNNHNCLKIRMPSDQQFHS